MKRKNYFYLALVISMSVSCGLARGQTGPTEITKWQDGKTAAISLTFDDNSLNQFRVAVPLMNRLGLTATFHLITGEISGSRYHSTFIGRATRDIIRETELVPTNNDNFFERASAIGHLGLQGTLGFHESAGELYEDGRVSEAYRLIDEAYAQVRQGVFKPIAASKKSAEGRDVLTWDGLRALAEKGYEFSSHTVTHPRLAVLDEANLVYELDKSREDILDHLGPKHTFTVECPYGTENERVMKYALARYPASRNRLPELFLEEINRGSDRDPAASNKEYVQWQRGALTATPMAVMKSWVDTIAAHHNMWLVLVFHGVDGIGWEPKTGADLEEYFTYIKSKQDRVWVATFQDVVKYMRERKHAAVQTSRGGDVIEVTLRHDLQKGLYDLPLTLKTRVPPSWTSVEVRQGNRSRQVPTARDEKGTFALYQAVPNAEPVRLARAGK